MTKLCLGWILEKCVYGPRLKYYALVTPYTLFLLSDDK